MNLETILVFVGIVLLFSVPSLLFGAYTTVFSYFIHKIRNTTVRILVPLAIALLFIFIEPVYHMVIMTWPWDLIPDGTILAMAVLLPLPLVEGHLQAKKKEVPAFICATLTFLYLFVTGFAAAMSSSGADPVSGPLFFDAVRSLLDSFQNDYLFKIVYRLLQFFETILFAAVFYGVLIVLYRVKNRLSKRWA